MATDVVILATTATAIAVSLAYLLFYIVNELVKKRALAKSVESSQEDVVWRVKLCPTERFYLKYITSDKYAGSHNICATMEVTFDNAEDVNYEKYKSNVAYVLRALQLKHPLLQVGIEYDHPDKSHSIYQDNWYFVRRTTVPYVQIHDTDDDWRVAHKDAMNHTWNLNGPFMAVTIVKGDLKKGKSHIVFSFHHVICDASCCSNLVCEFAMIMNEMSHNGSGPSDLPCSLEELDKEITVRPLPKTLIEQLPEYSKSTVALFWFVLKMGVEMLKNGALWPTVRFPLVDELPEYRRSDFFNLTVQESTTKSLLEQCKARNVSATNLIHAVLTKVLYSMFGANGSHSVMMPFTIDLRKNTGIKCTNEDFRFLSSCIQYYMRIHPKSDIWDMAVESRKEFDHTKENNFHIDVHQSMLQISKIPLEDRAGIMPAVLGNIGRIDVLKGKSFSMKLINATHSTQGLFNMVSIIVFTTDEQLNLSFSFNNAIKNESVLEFYKKVDDEIKSIASIAATA
jgi:NRPS condensation-like uncharacterized protein